MSDFFSENFPTLDRKLDEDFRVRDFIEQNQQMFEEWFPNQDDSAVAPALDLLAVFDLAQDHKEDDHDELTDYSVLLLSTLDSFLVHLEQTEFPRWVRLRIDKLISELNSYEAWTSTPEKMRAIELVEDLGQQLTKLQNPGDEGIAGQIGNVQGALRSINKETRAFVVTRVQATFAVEAFHGFLGKAVWTGVGYLLGSN